MNTLLFYPDEVSESSILISGIRADRLIADHALQPGLTVRSGIIGGELGRSKVLSAEAGKLILEGEHLEAPPPRLPLILVVGLSRPQTVKKVIQAATTLGVTELHLVRSELGEKSYLSAQVLKDENLREEIELGLAQAVDTIAPVVQVHSRFLPCVEDGLPARLNAHGWNNPTRCIGVTRSAGIISSIPRTPSSKGWLVSIGPEAGWSEFELERFTALGYTPISLGPRMLRVETAVTAAIAQVMAADH